MALDASRDQPRCGTGHPADAAADPRRAADWYPADLLDSVEYRVGAARTR
jgi:hypothetical protein